MDIDFYNRTRLDSVIVSLVGDRISNSFDSDNEYPKIVYLDLNAGLKTKSHLDLESDAMQTGLIQVDIFGKDADTVAPVASRMATLWDEYRRSDYGSTFFIRVAMTRNQNIPADMPSDNSELGIYRRSMDFNVHFRDI
jgi:hypothetical protein